MVMLHIGDKNIEGLEVKIEEFELYSKNMNIADGYGSFSDLKEGYRP
jgi:hypothetical protein